MTDYLFLAYPLTALPLTWQHPQTVWIGLSFEWNISCLTLGQHNIYTPKREECATPSAEAVKDFRMRKFSLEMMGLASLSLLNVLTMLFLQVS